MIRSVASLLWWFASEHVALAVTIPAVVVAAVTVGTRWHHNPHPYN